MSHNQISSGEYHNVRNTAPSTQCTSLTFIITCQNITKKKIIINFFCVNFV